MPALRGPEWKNGYWGKGNRKEGWMRLIFVLVW